MASKSKETRPTAAESLVKATVTVLDKVEVQAQFDRASIETSRRLGGSTITYLS
mgnify:CR=1 FL=1|jgi:hypothetical protein